MRRSPHLGVCAALCPLVWACGGGTMTPPVQAAFASELLRRDVVDVLFPEAPGDGTVQRLPEWHERGANAELDGIAESHGPALDLSEYARSLLSDPPEEARVELVADWAQTQGAGEFYILMEQAMAEASHLVWAELRSDAPAFVPLGGAELRRRLTDSLNASVV